MQGDVILRFFLRILWIDTKHPFSVFYHSTLPNYYCDIQCNLYFTAIIMIKVQAHHMHTTHNIYD